MKEYSRQMEQDKAWKGVIEALRIYASTGGGLVVQSTEFPFATVKAIPEQTGTFELELDDW